MAVEVMCEERTGSGGYKYLHIQFPDAEDWQATDNGFLTLYNKDKSRVASFAFGHWVGVKKIYGVTAAGS